MFLTKSELSELTGYKSAGWQARWLRQNCIPFVLNRLKQPKVMRSTLEQQFGGKVTGPRTQPDFDAIDDG